MSFAVVTSYVVGHLDDVKLIFSEMAIRSNDTGTPPSIQVCNIRATMYGERNPVERLLINSMSANHVEHASIKKRPYIFLLQHALSFSQRCGLQPGQRCQWYDSGTLWLEYIAKTVLINSIPTVSEPSRDTGSSLHVPSVVFVATLSQTKSSIVETTRVRLIQIDPIDRNCDADELLHPHPTSLERLETIIAALKNLCNPLDLSINMPFVLIFDSISPILMRHGFKKTLLFLQELVRSISHVGVCRLVVVPIRSELLSTHQRKALEIALLPDAILNVSQQTPAFSQHFDIDTYPEFNAVLLRRGFRESDRVHRDIIPHRFCAVTDDFGRDEISYRNCRYEIDFRVHMGRAPDGDDITSSTSLVVIQEVGYRGKSNINLHLHDGHRRSVSGFTSADPLQTQKQPNIFMQDNDPEFEDYDDEEPDDDLDL